MRKLTPLLLLLSLVTLVAHGQKQVYIPPEFSNAPLNEWSWDKTYESDNFVVFWGNVVGTDPINYSNSDLAFDPAELTGYLEDSYDKFVNDIGFVTNTGNLGTYKIIVVMNDTYAGSGGPSGWAFGGSYGNTIGSMWVHPGATRDPYVLSHEFAHSLQAQNNIQQNPSGGFVGYDPAGWVWESHANFMRCAEFPFFAGDDMPRWLMTRSFHVASTRHHYSSFKWLMNIQQNYGGMNTINRLWKESLANETATETWRRISGWSQSQLNDAMFDYAKREVNFDYPAQGFGADMRDQIAVFENNASDNWWLWRRYTILEEIDAASGRYLVPNYIAPQDYGMNIIPLYPDCSSNTVHVKLRGHTEVHTDASWRWGFVELTSSGNSLYGTMQTTSNGEVSYTLTAPDSELFLVVMGAPTLKHYYLWEAGLPRVYRYPYELRIENAVPEGHQSTFRADVKSLFPGSTHSNGGGWVASTASVSASVYVGPKAVVLGSSNLSGSVRVEGTARIQDATANGSVVFSGNCQVMGGTYSGTAQVMDGAVLVHTDLSGDAICKDVMWSWGVAYGSGVVVGGDAEIGSCSTAGVYLQTPHPNNGRGACDGLGATHSSNQDINNSYTLFTDAEMGWTAIGCGECIPTQLTAYTQVNGGSWSQTTTASLTVGDEVMFEPQPAGGAWSWSGPNGFVASTREVTITDVQLSDVGTYVAAYTNACGTTSTLSFEMTVDDGIDNIAPLAIASTSFVSAWETLSAINDNSNPSHSNDKSQGAYGNWNNPNSIQWVQYDWSEDYAIHSIEVYWFDDNGGVLTPTTAYLEYWNGSAWINAGDVPKVKDDWNILTLSGVSTSRLRLSMLNTMESTGILEWKVIGSASSSRVGAVSGDPASTIDYGVNIYPNPSFKNFTVELTGFAAEEPVSLEVMDLSGSVLASYDLGHKRTLKLHKRQLSLSSGCYLISIHGNGQVITRKLVLAD